MVIVNETDGPAIEGVCGVEEALPLLEALAGGAALSLGRCTHLHTAPLQVLLALRPALRGAPPAEPFLARWVAPLLTDRTE